MPRVGHVGSTREVAVRSRIVGTVAALALVSALGVFGASVGVGLAGAAVAPGAPTALVATAGNTTVSIAFRAPVAVAGVTITGYEGSFSRNGGSWSGWYASRPVRATSPVAFTGLTNGVSYRVRLRAVTSAGARGSASVASGAFTPRAAPSVTTTTSTTGPPPTTSTTTPPTTVPLGGTEVFVSTTGNDGAAGTRAAPLRSLAEAWGRIPSGTSLTTPFTVTLLPGDYPAASMPNYWEHRLGTAAAPITIRSDAPGRPVTLRGDLNVFDVHHFTLQGVRVAPGGDAFHCEQCTDVVLDDVELDGTGGAWDLLKVNQSSGITVRNSFIHGAGDNSIDFVAVQHASITGNLITTAGDWCAYVKGGSTDVLVAGNEIAHCGTGGFTAGQGTGLEWMVAPWLTYEATDVTFRDNHVHDTEGAAFGVNGGSNILIEGNHAERVGTRSHLIEVTFGMRSCDGNTTRCGALLTQGAWGVKVTGDVAANIPDRNVVIRNNVIVNPPGVRSQWQDFEISTPRTNTGPQVGPSPARTDTGLVITGNTIVNGDASMPLGIDDSVVCTPTNPTCTVAQIFRDNVINGL